MSSMSRWHSYSHGKRCQFWWRGWLRERIVHVHAKFYQDQTIRGCVIAILPYGCHPPSWIWMKSNLTICSRGPNFLSTYPIWYRYLSAAEISFGMKFEMVASDDLFYFRFRFLPLKGICVLQKLGQSTAKLLRFNHLTIWLPSWIPS